MDDREKKELVKKIMEQRKALWNRKADLKPDTLSQSRQENVRKTSPKTEPIDITSIRDIPVEITQEDNVNVNKDRKLSKSKTKSSLMTELKQTGELGFRVIFTVIIILISAILLGVIIGYGITAIHF